MQRGFSRALIGALLLGAALAPRPAAAQFKIPKIGGVKVPGVKLPDFPGLDSLLNGEEPITSSFADALSEVPFLDDFDPKQSAALDELPRDASLDFYIYPGIYAYTAQSYCLHAGTHGPGKGEGYLLAPLKGPKAPIVRNILRRSADHPEIEQHNIQVLIWAILARTKLSDMPRDYQDTASKLLTKKELAELQGGALGVIPDDIRERVFSKVPDVLRPIYEAENRLRSMMSSAVNAPYEQMERVAVLSGEPEEDKKGREIPRGRWSFHPDGFFIRYIPESYPTTHVMLAVPDHYTVERDAKGRITSLTDTLGSRIEIAYDDAVAPLAVSGDDGVKGYAFKSVRFVTPDTATGKPVEQTFADTGYVLVGTPSRGRADEAGRFPGAAARYDQARATRDQLDGLIKPLPKLINLDNSRRTTPSKEAVAQMMDLLNLRAALLDLGRDKAANDARFAVALEGPTLAWMDAFERSTATGMAAALPASSAFDCLGLYAGRGGFGGSYSPSGGSAMPGNTGRQRLAQSSRSHSPGSRPTDKARNATNALSHMPGMPPGTQIPMWMTKQLLNKDFDIADKIDHALNGEGGLLLVRLGAPWACGLPDDYHTFATVQKVEVPEAPAGNGVSAARAAAIHDLSAAMADLAGALRAVGISRDRSEAAIQAGDNEWGWKQGAAVVTYKHQAGAAMLRMADALDTLVKAAQADGVQDKPASDMVREEQDDLKANGPSARAKALAKALGLSDAEVDQLRQAALAEDAGKAEGSVYENMTESAKTLRAAGARLAAMPNLPLPAAGAP